MAALKAAAPMAADDPKLDFYLSHAVTEYDRRQMRSKYHNIYALGHYLGAVEKTRDAIATGAEVRAAVLQCFTGRLADFVLKTIGHPAMTDQEARS